MRYMKKKKYENIEEFCEDAVDNYESLDSGFPTVSVVVKYNEARQILSELCTFGYIPFSIELHDEECDGYNDEYLITLTKEGIFCEPAKLKGTYLNIESNCTYVLDDCNSKILSKISSDYIYEVSFDEDEEILFDEYNDFDEDDYELECCNCCDDMHGFTVHKNDRDGYSSLSFYSTDKLCTCELEHLMDIFGF